MGEGEVIERPVEKCNSNNDKACLKNKTAFKGLSHKQLMMLD